MAKTLSKRLHCLVMPYELIAIALRCVKKGQPRYILGLAEGCYTIRENEALCGPGWQVNTQDGDDHKCPVCFEDDHILVWHRSCVHVTFSACLPRVLERTDRCHTCRAPLDGGAQGPHVGVLPAGIGRGGDACGGAEAVRGRWQPNPVQGPCLFQCAGAGLWI
mmetsp:Transcript_63862/g.177564  ORF Transcript_63862/g.177564 Transcript_63862/m.177564 type:complete len:163 (-) Transcript_63862:180-668(-)